MSAPPTISPSSPSDPLPGADAAPVIIDAHHHLWDVEAADHAWLTATPAIDQTFAPADLHTAATTAGVTGTVLVQVLASLPETRGFCSLAADDPLIRGVVGWADLTSELVAEDVTQLREGAGGDRLVGIRHLVQDEPDERWLAADAVRAGLAAVGEAGLVYDLLLKPWHLPVANETVAATAGTRFVLDHLAKPDIAHWEPGSPDFADWARDLTALAAHDHVAAKVSGILTEAGTDFSIERLTPYVQVVVEAFGPERLMVGSDWPVSLLATDYATVWASLTGALQAAGVTDPELARILGPNAVAWYGLPD